MNYTKKELKAIKAFEDKINHNITPESSKLFKAGRKLFKAHLIKSIIK